MTDFERAMQFIHLWEGGKSDDPSDPGGRTAYGCTQRTFDDYCRAQGKPTRDVWTITNAEVQAVYRLNYWDKVTPGRPWPLNAVLMDTAVNCGPGRALRWLEEAKATVSTSNPRRMVLLAAKVMASREAYYGRLRGQMPKYYRGWMNRCHALRSLTGLLK